MPPGKSEASAFRERAASMSFSAARRARVSRWQRAFDDPRNALVREFVRLVAELDARCFVFENVKGLTVGPHRRFWKN